MLVARYWISGCLASCAGSGSALPDTPANEPARHEPVETGTRADDGRSARNEACSQAWMVLTAEQFSQSLGTMVRASTDDRIRSEAQAMAGNRIVELVESVDSEPFKSLGRTTRDLATAMRQAADGIRARNVSSYVAARAEVDKLREERAALLSAVVAECEASSWKPERRMVVKGGRLPKEVIQQGVRAQFSMLRRCYEEGLAEDSELAGQVVARFVIERDGTVGTVTISDRLVPNGPDEEADLAFLEEANGGLPALHSGQTTMPNDRVSLCVGRGYYGLEFPPPENGIVTVVYPISFSPGL